MFVVIAAAVGKLDEAADDPAADAQFDFNEAVV